MLSRSTHQFADSLRSRPGWRDPGCLIEISDKSVRKSKLRGYRLGGLKNRFPKNGKAIGTKPMFRQANPHRRYCRSCVIANWQGDAPHAVAEATAIARKSLGPNRRQQIIQVLRMGKGRIGEPWQRTGEHTGNFDCRLMRKQRPAGRDTKSRTTAAASRPRHLAMPESATIRVRRGRSARISSPSSSGPRS